MLFGTGILLSAKTDAVCRIVDTLVETHLERALVMAGRWQPDHPLDREAAENLMAVMQDLDMLASLRRNFCQPGWERRRA